MNAAESWSHRIEAGHPGMQEAARLASLAAQWPGHDLTREDTGHGPRYIARARTLDTSPSLVMTATLDDLAAQLGLRPDAS